MGYLIIDDKASGGIVKEYDTKPCEHCAAAVTVSKARFGVPGEEEIAVSWCTRCNGIVCDKPPCNIKCIPFYSKIEKALARQCYIRTRGF